MAEPTPWIRKGTFIYQLTEDDRGRPVNLWSISVQGGGPFAASEAEREDVARLIAKARHLPELVNALEAVDVWFTDLAIRPDDLEDPGPNWRSDMIRAMRAVRAALALVQDEDHG